MFRQLVKRKIAVTVQRGLNGDGDDETVLQRCSDHFYSNEYDVNFTAEESSSISTR